MIQVVLPPHLRDLARVGNPVLVNVPAPVTPRSVLDAIEAQYPMLKGTIRDHTTHKRRPFLRYFAGEDDVSFADLDEPLPEAVSVGRKPFVVLGALAGG